MSNERYSFHIIHLLRMRFDVKAFNPSSCFNYYKI